jgi:hypothetical protein
MSRIALFPSFSDWLATCVDKKVFRHLGISINKFEISQIIGLKYLK